MRKLRVPFEINYSGSFDDARPDDVNRDHLYLCRSEMMKHWKQLEDNESKFQKEQREIGYRYTPYREIEKVDVCITGRKPKHDAYKCRITPESETAWSCVDDTDSVLEVWDERQEKWEWHDVDSIEEWLRLLRSHDIKPSNFYVWVEY